MEFESVRMCSIFSAILRRKCGKRVFVEFTVLADTLVDAKALTVFCSCKRVAAVRALKEEWGSRRPLEEAVIAYLA